jgi:hypothetical protein
MHFSAATELLVSTDLAGAGDSSRLSENLLLCPLALESLQLVHKHTAPDKIRKENFSIALASNPENLVLLLSYLGNINL